MVRFRVDGHQIRVQDNDLPHNPPGEEDVDCPPTCDKPGPHGGYQELLASGPPVIVISAEQITQWRKEAMASGALVSEPDPAVSLASTEPSQDQVDYVNRLMEASSIPESWDDDASADYILERYLLELERRVLALGGSLEAWPEEEDDDGNALRCPTCTSREPRLHPAAGAGGEVTHMCPDTFHAPPDAVKTQCPPTCACQAV